VLCFTADAPSPVAAGVVHGDLKSGNVLLTGSSTGRLSAKVADFGLALCLDPHDTHATMAARVRTLTRLRRLHWAAGSSSWLVCIMCTVVQVARH
jgi:serine/threonine protein kinase